MKFTSKSLDSNDSRLNYTPGSSMLLVKSASLSREQVNLSCQFTSHLLHNSAQICLLMTTGNLISCSCASERAVNWWWHRLCFECLIPELHFSTFYTILLMEKYTIHCFGKKLQNDTQQFNISLLLFLIFFIYFHIKSVSNWQSENLLSKHFQMYHSFFIRVLIIIVIHPSPVSNPPSEECSTEMINKQNKQ